MNKDKLLESVTPEMRQGLYRSSLVLLLIFSVACIVVPNTVATFTGYKALNTHTTTLVDRLLADNQTAFLAVSATKAGLAIIEGSEVGVGFELEIGDVVQPAYDYVDFFWEIFLYAFLILGAYKLLMETGILELGIVITGVGLMLWSIGNLSQRPRRASFLFAGRIIFAGLILTYLLPLSLVITYQTSVTYTTKLRAKHYERIADFGQSLGQVKENVKSLNSEISLLNPSDSINAMKQSFQTNTGIITKAFNESFLSFLFYGLLLTFDTLIFPLISAFIIWKLTKALSQRLFSPPQQQLVAPKE